LRRQRRWARVGGRLGRGVAADTSGSHLNRWRRDAGDGDAVSYRDCDEGGDAVVDSECGADRGECHGDAVGDAECRGDCDKWVGNAERDAVSLCRSDGRIGDSDGAPYGHRDGVTDGDCDRHGDRNGDRDGNSNGDHGRSRADRDPDGGDSRD
jgi:hypothetical protein